MNYYKNGILIQETNEKNIFLKKYADSFIYNGVHIFSDTPLSDIKKTEKLKSYLKNKFLKR